MTSQRVVVRRLGFSFSYGSMLDHVAQWLVTFKNKLLGTIFGISVSIIVGLDRRDDL